MGSDCNQCELAQYRANIVLGRGNNKAKVAIIGEAPGREEDAVGQPFVGRSGNLMTAMLYELGITENDYFVTNTVRCRPPGNRAPNSREVAACNQHLMSELNGFTRIMTVGKTPLCALLNKQNLRLSDYIGKDIEVELGGIKRILTPNYHPAFILRFMDAQVEWKDISRRVFDGRV